MSKVRGSKVIVLLSGGLDSSLTAAYLQENANVVYGLFVDRGQKNLEKEFQATKRIAEMLRIEALLQSSLSLKGLRDLITPDVIRKRGIPGRNLILVTMATPYADLLECELIATGNVITDTFSDCDTQFRESLSPVISLVLERQISVVSPFADWEQWDKSDEIRWGVESGYEKIIKMSWSCWASGPKHCGECGACIDRKEGFRKAGVLDPTEYNVDYPSDYQVVARS